MAGIGLAVVLAWWAQPSSAPIPVLGPMLLVDLVESDSARPRAVARIAAGEDAPVPPTPAQRALQSDMRRAVQGLREDCGLSDLQLACAGDLCAMDLRMSSEWLLMLDMAWPLAEMAVLYAVGVPEEATPCGAAMKAFENRAPLQPLWDGPKPPRGCTVRTTDDADRGDPAVLAEVARLCNVLAAEAGTPERWLVRP